ncbi:hypothetical protein CISIN_1g021302mg [Citrus sinensis]|uniref:ZF-HD dimerization-type domain-containing protein n=1 Tax=Citrus sinensis TaxID=2711 RepID=A0A067GVU9_CITSI|nr:hypothetical protein CISIN_1g021302mg [Citrus sinensis]KDO79572.1 hypothetical protein CISIN_1g021302mg [Citrus sinensis]KDO79573.1 hypothetical protein CISIN_1g021302mg [Citrus sinensis]KDO79574.1 hypothetical protein CISIN_1g021302mg [Citrus sinensis]
MELQGKEKEIGMTSSMRYNRDSSSTVSTPINSIAGEMIRDQGTVHGEAIFNLPQTLDQHHHPLYRHHQSNSQQQQQPQTQQNLQNKPSAGSSNPEAQHPDPVPVSVANTTTTSTKEANRSNQRSPAQAPTTSTAIITAPSIRYRECLKNHAANMGSHVIDGCGEFMPSGEDGTPEGLKCAACDCHRNFHRKEIDGESQSQSQYAAHSLYTYNYPSRNNSTQRNHHHQQQQQPPPPFHHLQQHHRISYTSPQTASIAPMMMTFGGGAGPGAVAGALMSRQARISTCFILVQVDRHRCRPRKRGLGQSFPRNRKTR